MILVTDTQLRQSIAIIRSFGKRGIPVVAADSEIVSTGFFSRYVSKRIVYPDPEINEQGFIAKILQTAQKYKVQMIIPVRDKSLKAIVKHKSLFLEHNIIIPTANYDLISNMQNKAKTLALAKKIGLDIPKTYESADICNIGEFPILLKPLESSGGRGIKLCKNKKELELNLKEKNDYFFAQEVLPVGGKEIGYYALCDKNSNIVAYTVQERIRSYPISGGPSTFRKTIHNEDIAKLGEKLLKSLKWQGVAMVEFKIDNRDNKPKLIEVNPRFWGSLALSISAGVDFPYLLYQVYKNEQNIEKPRYKENIKCRWLLPGDILWFLSAPKSWTNIKAFFDFKNTHYDIINLNDPLPILGVFLAAITYLFSFKKLKYVFRKKLQ